MTEKARLPEKLIPSSRGKDLGVFSPLCCEYGVNAIVRAKITAGSNNTAWAPMPYYRSPLILPGRSIFR